MLLNRREFHLLAGLLAHRNETIPLTRLARLVWGSDGEPSRNALQARVSHLRRALALEEDRLLDRVVQASLPRAGQLGGQAAQMVTGDPDKGRMAQGCTSP